MIALAVVLVATPVASAAPERVSPSTAAASTSEDPRIEAVRALIASTWAQRPHAGLTVGISAPARVTPDGTQPAVRWVEGFGFAHVRRKRPATATTSYRMASVTKMMTAVGVMQLVERGRVDLDDEVQRYVPSFPQKREPITVRHLLGHLSGISHYKNRARETHFQRPFTTAESLAVFKDWPLVAAPGERYVYTSYGYDLLGAVIEKQSGLGYDAYLKRKVFKPLGIRGAGVEQRAKKKKSWAQGYKLSGDRLVRSESVDITSRFAGGGTRATVDDMVRFGEGLLGGELVSAESLAMMQEPMFTLDGEVTDYGMGMASYPVGGRWVIAHAGSQAETSTLLLMMPAEGLVVAIAQNLEDQWTANHHLAGRIVELMLLDGEVRRGITGRTERDSIMAAGLTRVFSHGLGQFRLRSARIDEGPGDLLRAFRTTNTLLDPDRLSADLPLGWAAIQQGLGPNTDRALPKVGAFMAAVIASVDGPAALDKYGPTSVTAFVRDYLAVCAQIDCPQGFLPSAKIQAFVARTDPPLAEAYPDALRTWELTAKDDPHVVEERLREAFRDAPVIPDYAGELRGFGEQALFDGALAKASRWLELSHALYPQDTRTTLALAHVRYAGGDHARGDLMMTAVVDLPGGEDLLKPSRLKYAAWRLEKAGFKPAGRDLVAWGARHHQDPELFRLLANKRAALGDKAGAAEALKNAKATKAAKRAAPSKR